MKRALDLALALPLAVLALPAIAALAFAIRLDSRGSAFFSQMRVGRDGVLFRCHKLRTMRIGTPSAPTHEVASDAVTSVGRWLRRTKLDELPQLWNVICGEMSLVGPRPCLPTQKQLIDCRTRLGVLTLRPGLTGLAQIRGIDMSDPERCASADADYLSSMSMRTDLALLARTLFGGR